MRGGGGALFSQKFVIYEIMQLDSQAYQWYFQVCIKYGPWGPYFSVLFDPWGNRLKVSFTSILQKVSTGFTGNFLSSLELLLEVCRIRAPRGQKAHWDKICSRHNLYTTGLIFMTLKPYEIPSALDAHWLGHVSLEAPGGLQRAQGAQILPGI